MDGLQTLRPMPLPKKQIPVVKIALAALFVAAVVGLFFVLPVKTYWSVMLNWIKSMGAWGMVLFVVLYVLFCLLLLPAWILTMGAGFVYGLGWGAVLVLLGATLGCAAAFKLGRTLARAKIARWVEQHPKWAVLDQALGDTGFAMVFLLRLSPVFPFSLLNYALGLTRISLKTYVFASGLGMIPGLFMYVYLGSAAHSFTELASRRQPSSLEQLIFFWVGLAATVLVVVMVTRLAAARLKTTAN